jgi:hypothetical protein
MAATAFVRARRDVKLVKKRGKEMGQLKTLLALLIEENHCRPRTLTIR